MDYKDPEKNKGRTTLNLIIDPEVRKNIKILCAYNRRTIKDYITELITNDLEKNKDILNNVDELIKYE